MEEEAANTTEVQFKDVLDRCILWDRDVYELRELGIILQCAYRDDHLSEVASLAEALLQADQLPHFYKAKMYGYLSTCEGYDSTEYLDLATIFLEAAKSGLTWIPEEIVQWEEIIANQRIKASRYEDMLAVRKASSGVQLGAIDGTEEYDLVEVSTGTNILPAAYGGPEVASTDKAARVVPTFDYDIPKEQKIRHGMAKIPKHMRKKLSVASFQRGTGSVGTLQQSKLRPKPSTSNFDIFKATQDENTKKEDQEEETKGQDKEEEAKGQEG